tara:strand:- start:178 stop:705 length:528 start_codon:yes stop_codon:yes gene_type:complete
MIRKWINKLIDNRLNSRLGELPDPMEPEIDYGAFDYGEIADHISSSDIAEYIEVEASDIADYIDISDVAGEIDLYELADNISASDIADEMSMDASDIAEHVDTGEIANELDLEELAGELDMADLAKELCLDEVTEELQRDMNTLKDRQGAIINALNNIELAMTEMRMMLEETTEE